MIDDAEMQHLKTLARLDLSPEETARVQADLNKILGYFEKLNELDTEGVPEMQRPVRLENVMRPDEPGEMLPQEAALGLAVDQQDGFFRVPRVIE
nr:Asp-tRNA(Asn)/Glu-tRNA(Gln) amidotransferase subunit GatC [Deinobacterium chartae]